MEETDRGHHLEARLIADALIVTLLGVLAILTDLQEIHSVIDELVLAEVLSMKESVAPVVVVLMDDLAAPVAI